MNWVSDGEVFEWCGFEFFVVDIFGFIRGVVFYIVDFEGE